MQNSQMKSKGLNKSVLQIIAVIAMLIDHIWLIDKMWYISNPWIYTLMNIIGAVTVVIMSYFVAEGYHKTTNLGKYITRMAVFAAISQIPYYFATNGLTITGNFNGLVVSMFYNRNVIFTLFVGLCLLTVLKSSYNILIKLIAIIAALWLAKYSDWSYYALLWIIGFGLFHGDKRKQMLWLAAVILIRLIITAIAPIIGIINNGSLNLLVLCNWISTFGCFLAIPLLASYNGERGNAHKWTFYVIYPLQFIIIILLNVIL